MTSALFAFSGVRAVTLIIPLALHGKLAESLLAVGLFGAGVVVSMTAFGLLVARGLSLAERLPRGAVLVDAGAGALAVALGGYWVLSHLV